MTRLDKPVCRVTRSNVRGYPLVITLDPAGFLELRLKGCRAERYRLGFVEAWIFAASRAAERQRSEKLRERRRNRH